MASCTGRPDWLWTSPQVPQLSRCVTPQTVTQTTAGWEKTKGNSRIGYIKMFRHGSQPCGSEMHHLCPARPATRQLRRHSFKGQVADVRGRGGGSGWATVRCPAALGTQTGPAGCLPLLSSPVSTRTFCLGSHTVHPPEGRGQAWAGPRAVPALPLGHPRLAPPLPSAHRGLWLGSLSAIFSIVWVLFLSVDFIGGFDPLPLHLVKEKPSSLLFEQAR